MRLLQAKGGPEEEEKKVGSEFGGCEGGRGGMPTLYFRYYLKKEDNATAFRDLGAMNRDKTSLRDFIIKNVPGVAQEDIAVVREDVPRHLDRVTYRKFHVGFRSKELYS